MGKSWPIFNAEEYKLFIWILCLQGGGATLLTPWVWATQGDSFPKNLVWKVGAE